MDLQPILSIADDIVFAKTGKHLDNLQQSILKGTLQGKRYSEIAKDNKCTRGHVKDVASDLWKILSEELGEDIKKSNIIATLERIELSNVSNFVDFVNIGNINICRESRHPPETPKKRSQITPVLDLDDAPPATILYGRTTELTTLQTWIIEQQSRLIAILGLAGIGKTVLTLKLIEQIKDNFDYIIWRSLNDFPNLDVLQEDLITVFLQQQDQNRDVKVQLRTLIQFLRQYRCLIVFDDVQVIFSNGQLAGYYQPQYQDYSRFFKQLGQANHRSCIILNSWEAPREIINLAEELPTVRLFYLEGLKDAAKEILREKGLRDEEKWEELIQVYRGHPLWLKIVGTMIQHLFGGRLSQSWTNETILLPEELKSILEQQLQCLSPLEIELISHLCQTDKPLSSSQLIENSLLSPSVTLNAIQSLIKRSLIEKLPDSDTCFTVAPIIKEYYQHT